MKKIYKMYDGVRDGDRLYSLIACLFSTIYLQENEKIIGKIYDISDLEGYKIEYCLPKKR